jgi:hypothetical protein
MSRLFQFNRRDCIGLACWFLVSLAIGLWSLLLMVARELYQWRRYHLPRFEWEDVVRYTVVIVVGYVVRSALW